MRIVCKYTGVSFHVEHFRNTKIPDGHHPVFDLSFNEKLQLAQVWGIHNDEERHLLFVALLEATKLVDFRAPAIPDQKTINGNMELLLETARWKQAIGDTVTLPGFRITRDNYTLKGNGFKSFLLRWHELRNDWLSKTDNQQLSETIRVREEYLTRRIEANFRELKKLGNWAMLVAGVPVSIRETWIRIFSLREEEDRHQIWKLHTDDIKAMLDHMTHYLDAGTTLGAMAFRHIRELLQINQDGMKYSLMDLKDEIIQEATYKTFADSPYVILTPSKDSNIVKWNGPLLKDGKLPSLTEVVNSINLQVNTDEDDFEVSMRMDTKPQPQDFDARWKFLRAEAAWEIKAEEVRKHKAAVEARRKAKIELDNGWVLGQDDTSDSEDTLQSSELRAEIDGIQQPTRKGDE